MKDTHTLPEIELELTLRQKFRKRPDLWYAHRFGGDLHDFYWRIHSPEKYSTHEWDGTKEPIATMFRALVKKKWVGIEAATGVGKTYTAPLVIFWFLDCYENSLVVTTAPKKSQLKAVLWKEIEKRYRNFKLIKPLSDLYAEPRIQVIANNPDFADWKVIGEVAGVESGAEVAQKMAGHHAENMLFVLEEASGITEAIWNAIVNTCTASNNLILAIGNPNSQTDTLHKHCLMERVEHIRISALDHPNIVLQQEIIPGAVSQASIDMRAKEYGIESHLYKSRVRGISPEQSTDSLILAKWIDACYQLELPQDDSENAAGVDVANSKDGDAASVAYGQNNHLLDLREFPCPNANHLAYNLIWDDLELQERGFEIYGIPTLAYYQIEGNIGVDAVGVGVGTINAFTDEDFDVTGLQGGALKLAIPKDAEGRELYTFGSLRDQMYFQARQDLQHQRVALHIPKHIFKQLKRELIMPRYSTKTGKIKVEAKEELKKRLGKSPNLADAFVYWNWMRHGWYAPQSTGFFIGAVGSH